LPQNFRPKSDYDGDEQLTGKINARARTIHDSVLILENGRTHCTITGQPTENHPGLGPTPLELCVMSHAGCYVAIVTLIAEKMRLELKSCDVKVEATKSEEAGTITEETFHVLFKLDATEEKIRRLHKLTLKNCPVGILFEKAGIKTTYKLQTQKVMSEEET
jgi:uncharacterized OsmC-like protein